MKRLLAGVLLGVGGAAAMVGWLAYNEWGEGVGDHGPYTWHRFDLGAHIVEIHIGSRS